MVNRKILVAGAVALFAIAFLASTMPASEPLATTIGAPAGAGGPDPSWVRTAPITITSDADWAGVASSGSGSALDPWIIENILIECNGSGTGIGIQNTNDYVIIRNAYINETGSGATDYGVGMGLIRNIALQNLTVDNCPSGIGMQVGWNVNITDCDILNATTFGVVVAVGSWHVRVANNNITCYADSPYSVWVYSNASYNTVENNYIEHVAPADGQGIRVEVSSLYNMIVNNTVVMAYDTDPDCIVVNNAATNNTIANNTLNGSDRSIIVSSSDSNTIFNNTISGCVAVGVHIQGSSYCTIANNTLDTNTTGISYDAPGSYLLVENNTITGGGVASAATNLEFTGNFITGTLAITGVTNIHGNIWFDYFDMYPYAVTANATTNVLEYEYPATPTVNDTAPRYWVPWFQRAETVNLRFYSNVNFEGILFDHLVVEVDGLTLAAPRFTPGDVLYHVHVVDFEGRVLHDQVYNLNATGTELVIGLDTSAQIFFSFWSSVDGFGIEFTWVKLYIDGVRLTRSDPIMRPRVIDVVIKDFLDVVLYDETVNLSTTGIYVDIALPITWVTIDNNYERTVIFHIIRGGVSTSITLAPGISLERRFSLGDYEYILTETNGTVIEERNHTFDETRPGSFVLVFGPVEVDIPDVTPVDTATPVALMVFIMVAVWGAIPVMFVIAARLRVPPPARARQHDGMGKGTQRLVNYR